VRTKRTFLIAGLFWTWFLTFPIFSGTITLKTSGQDECLEITSFLKNTKGAFFLYSFRTQKIFRFSQEGNFEKSFCRYGEGPGAVQRVLGMSYNSSNDCVYLPEFASGLSRISIFSCTGEFKEYMKTPFSQMENGRIYKLIFLKDGSYYAVISERIGWEKKGAVFASISRMSVYFVDQSTLSKKLVYQGSQLQEMADKPGNGGPRILFLPDRLVKITPDENISIAVSDENKLTIYDRQGENLETRILDVRQIPLTEAEFQKAKVELVGNFPNGSRMQFLAKKMLKLDYKPMYDNLFVLPEYDVITVVERRHGAIGYPESSKIIFFDKKGKEALSRKINGYVMSIEGNDVFIKSFDDEGDESFRVEMVTELIKSGERESRIKK